MIQGTLIRGTTPTHEFELPYPVELIKDIRLVYGQKNKVVLIKQRKQCIIQDGVIVVTLTQEDTLSFLPNKNIDIEIRIKLIDEQVVRNEEPITLRVLDTLDQEVM